MFWKYCVMLHNLIQIVAQIFTHWFSLTGGGD